MIPNRELTTRQRFVALLIIAGLCIFAYIHYFRFWNPSRPETPEKLGVLGRITAFEGFRYFSGYYNNLNYNHPVIYAHRGHKSNYRKMLTIVGPGIEQKFSIQNIEKAFSVYRDSIMNSKGVSRHRAPEKVEFADKISSADGFRYFSGYYNTHNNFPAVYLDESGHEKKLIIVGPGAEQDFSVQKSEEAFSTYKNLLRKRRYLK